MIDRLRRVSKFMRTSQSRGLIHGIWDQQAVEEGAQAFVSSDDLDALLAVVEAAQRLRPPDSRGIYARPELTDALWTALSKLDSE